MEMLYEYEFEEDDQIGVEPKEDLQLFLKELESHGEELDIEQIVKAFNLCIEFHEGQYRASGKPYYLHPVKVAMILIEEFRIFDTESVIACLLHDVIEDVKGNETEQFSNIRIRTLTIEQEFGDEVLEMVNAATKIKRLSTGAQQNKAATHRKLFLALVKDVRVILVKLADRLHNMRTLHYLKDKKQKEIAAETLNFYTPIAHRLGLTKIKMELEDRSLYFTDRAAYEAIRMALAEKRRDFINYIRVFAGQIESSLKKEGVKSIITIVHKHVYEIYQMIESGKTLGEIDNFYSMVITTESDDKLECYKVHGILVNAFNPVNHLQDYISQPKINFYQSLNTHLFGPDGKLVEVIIRTNEMEEIAEGGIATDFSLSEGRVRALEISNHDLEEWGQWMEDIIQERGEEAAKLIWDSIKNNIFDREVRVFTPDGVKVRLPARACPVDFAFAVSEDLGLHCISAKVNGTVRELNFPLSNGDRVDIIASPNSKPKPEWQNFVISYRAEAKLHKYFRENPEELKRVIKDKVDFEVKLFVRGEDKPGMLNKITEAIGRATITRISLDSSDADFGGALSVQVRDNAHLNSLYAKLFSIKGIKSVEQLEDE